jgi:hypothetical protein
VHPAEGQVDAAPGRAGLSKGGLQLVFGLETFVKGDESLDVKFGLGLEVGQNPQPVVSFGLEAAEDYKFGFLV